MVTLCTCWARKPDQTRVLYVPSVLAPKNIIGVSWGFGGLGSVPSHKANVKLPAEELC